MVGGCFLNFIFFLVSRQDILSKGEKDDFSTKKGDFIILKGGKDVCSTKKDDFDNVKGGKIDKI